MRPDWAVINPMTMKIKTYSVLAIFFLVAEVCASPEKPPLELAASSTWVVDYAADHCRLARKFGAGDTSVTILIDRAGPGEFFRLSLMGKPFKDLDEIGKAKIQFGPNEIEQELTFLLGDLDKVPTITFQGGSRVSPISEKERKAIKKADFLEKVNFAPVGDDRHKAILVIRIGKPLRNAIVLQTKSMGSPFKALDKCVESLMTNWGIDIEKHKTLRQEVIPLSSPSDWMLKQGLPAKRSLQYRHAIVEFRLMISLEGKPTSCHIQLSSAPKDFGDSVCAGMTRYGQFKPALDANGNPLISYYRNTVYFNTQ